MKRLLKDLARILLGEYSIYRIYRLTGAQVVDADERPQTQWVFDSISRDQVLASGDETIRAQANYHGPDSRAFGCLVGGRIVAICFFWFGQRYRARNFWPLKDREAKLVQIITVPNFRGRGIATALIEWSARRVLESDFDSVYARIWHSNTPSIKAFQRAGWKHVADVVEVNPFRTRKSLRMVRRVSSATR